MISPYPGLAYPGLYMAQRTIVPDALPDGVVDVYQPCVDFAVAAPAWTPPTQWSVDGQPKCLKGLLCGTPVQVGTFTITVTAVDATGLTVTRTYTYTVYPQGTP